MKFLRNNSGGIALCLAIAGPAWFLVARIEWLEVIGAPVLAILLGMILGACIKDASRIRPGVGFVSKKVLQYAVILLGFGLNLGTIAQVGKASLPIILATISVSLGVAFALHKLFKVPSRISTLVGVGSAICGGSAIAATAPVIEADSDEIAQAVSVIFMFNVIAALVFPGLGGAIGLSNEGFALFAGTAINDTSSVTAAASTWDSLHGTRGAVLEHATIVKLTRTLAIIPITFVLGLFRLRQAGRVAPGADSAAPGGSPGVTHGAAPEGSPGEAPGVVFGVAPGAAHGATSGATTAPATRRVTMASVFPVFIAYFVLASLITTILNATLSGSGLDYTKAVFAFLKTLSKFFIVMAMGAIGLNTNIVKLVKTGGKPILMGLACWLAIASTSLLLQRVTGIW